MLYAKPSMRDNRWHSQKKRSCTDLSDFVFVYFTFGLQSELESQVYSKLSKMLSCMESHTQSADVERVNELIKVCCFSPSSIFGRRAQI